MALTLVGCGNSRPAACSDVDSLQSSVDNLKEVNVRENGLSELSSNLSQVKQGVDQLVKDAQSQYRQQIDGVESAINRLSSSASAAKADATAATLSAVRAGVQGVQSAFDDLRQRSPARAEPTFTLTDRHNHMDASRPFRMTQAGVRSGIVDAVRVHSNAPSGHWTVATTTPPWRGRQ